MVFKNANEAFNHFYYRIQEDGIVTRDTKALFDVGFLIQEPLDNLIANENRAWDVNYAEAEWQWYLTGDSSIYRLGYIYGKIPKIWQMIANEDGRVNSNYGFYWFTLGQYDNVLQILKDDPESRRASLSIYDANDINMYSKDTPCTYAINFSIVKNKLNMSVMMRSNDLWFGFCNDQYCFSRLQEKMAKDLDIEIGTYFHFVNNLHLYKKHLK